MALELKPTLLLNWVRCLAVVGILIGQAPAAASQSAETAQTMASTQATGEIAVLTRGHSSSVIQAGFSADGQRILTSGYKTTVLWNAGTGEELSRYANPSGVLLAFFPDGSSAISANSDLEVRTWDLQTQQTEVSATYEGSYHSWDVGKELATLSSNRRTLATASGDGGPIQLWSTQPLTRTRTLGSDRVLVKATAFSPDGKTLALGLADGRVRLLSPGSMKELHVFQAHEEAVNGLRFSPTGAELLTGSEDGSASLWNLQGRLLQTLPARNGKHPDGISFVDFTTDGALAILGEIGGQVRSWRPANGETAPLDIASDDEITAIAIEPDGPRLATGHESGQIKLWDLTSGHQLRAVTAHDGEVTAIGFSPDGGLIVSGGRDSTLKTWRPEAGGPKFLQDDLDNPVMSLAFTHDGRFLLIGSDYETLALWDLQLRRNVWTREIHEDVIESITVSPTDNAIATVSHDGSTAVWQFPSMKEVARFRELMPSSMAFCDSDRTLIAATERARIFVWNTETGEVLNHFQANSVALGIDALGVTEDCLVMATGSTDGLRTWNPLTGEKLEGASQEGYVSAAELSPDGELVVYRSDKLKLLNRRTNKILWEQDFEHRPTTLRFSPDGNRLLVGYNNGEMAMVETATGGPIWEAGTRVERLRELAFDPTGLCLLLGGEGGAVSALDLAAGKLLWRRQVQRESIDGLEYSSRGTRVLTSSGFPVSAARVWATESGRVIRTLEGKYFGASAKLDRILTSGSDVGLYLHRFQDRTTVASIPTERKTPRALLSPAADLVSIYLDPPREQLQMLDITGKIRWSREQGGLPVAFSDDGSFFFAHDTEDLYVLDTGDGRELARLEGATDSVAFSSELGRLAYIKSSTESERRDVHFLELERFTSSEFMKHTHARSIAFAPGSRLLVLATDQAGVSFFDVERKRKIVTVKLFADGSWIATDGAGAYELSASANLYPASGEASGDLEPIAASRHQPGLLRDSLTPYLGAPPAGASTCPRPFRSSEDSEEPEASASNKTTPLASPANPIEPTDSESDSSESMTATIARLLAAMKGESSPSPSVQLATDLNNRGVHALGSGNHQEGISHLREALDVLGDADIALRVRISGNLGAALLEMGRHQEAAEVLQECLPQVERLAAPLHQAHFYNNYGGLLLNLGRLAEAAVALESALRSALAADDDNFEAWARINLGLVNHRLGHLKDAHDFLTAGIDIAEQLDDPRPLGNGLLGLAQLLIDTGEHEDAIPLLEEALAMSVGLPSEGLILHMLGISHLEIGVLSSSEEELKRSLETFLQLGNESEASLVLSSLGRLEEARSDDQAAFDYLSEAVAKARSSGNDLATASTLIGLARLLEETLWERESQKLADHFGELPFSTDLLREALSIARKLGDRRVEMQALIGLARGWRFIHKFSPGPPDDRTFEELERALELSQALQDRKTESVILSELGHAHTAARQWDRSFAFLSEALTVATALDDLFGRLAIHHHLMIHYVAQKSFSAAAFHGKYAMRLLERLQFSPAAGGEPEDILRFLVDVLVLSNRLPEAQRTRHLLKGFETNNFFHRPERTAATINGILFTEVEEPWQAELGQISQAVVDFSQVCPTLAGRPWAEEPRACGERERLSFEKKKTMLIDHLTAIARQGSEVDLIARDTEQKWARTGNSAIEAGITHIHAMPLDSEVRLVAAHHQGTKVGYYPIQQDDLQEKVVAFRQRLQDRESNPRPLARELYEILFAPLEEFIEASKSQRLVWHLDGVLRYLPTAALHDGNGYLVERFVSSLEGAPREFSPRYGERSRALALGMSRGSGDLPPLEGVAVEIDLIVDADGEGPDQGFFPGLELMNEDFSLEAIAAAARDPFDIVHVGSHFQFHPGSARRSFLLMGDGQRLSVSELAERDGLFTGVSLVVLAACETAVVGGRQAGDDIESLGRLVQDLGAESVVASLWAVGDLSTSALMAGFYRHLSSTQQTPVRADSALRVAQLSLLEHSLDRELDPVGARGVLTLKGSAEDARSARDFSHPYYWAGFIHIGRSTSPW